jgi:ParB family transcriptional regulator, chromosome partitioning protein
MSIKLCGVNSMPNLPPPPKLKNTGGSSIARALSNRGISQAIADEGDIQELPLSALVALPQQVRRYFDEAALRALVEDIRAQGILQPLVVRPVPIATAGDPLSHHSGMYQVVAGERRLRAAQRLGLATVPVVVRALSDAQVIEVNALENLNRADLNPYEELLAVLALLQSRLGQSEAEVREFLVTLANAKLGRGKGSAVAPETTAVIEEVFARLEGRCKLESFVAHRLPLLDAPDDVQAALAEGWLEYTKAKRLLKVTDITVRAALLQQLREGMSVKSLDQALATLQPSTDPAPATAQWQQQLQSQLGVPVRIKTNRNGGGALSLTWATEAELQQLMAVLEKLQRPATPTP